MGHQIIKQPNNISKKTLGVTKMISKNKIAKIARILNFEVANGFVRKGELETTYLYIYNDGKKKSWKMSIYANNKNEPGSDHYHTDNVVMGVETEEDVLRNLCKWYFDRGQATILTKVIKTSQNNLDNIYSLRKEIKE